MISCVSIEGGNYETQAIFIQYNLKAVYSVPWLLSVIIELELDYGRKK